MKPSDTEIDTQLNSTKDTINLQSKQSKTHIKPISNDIIDIKLASLQISDNPLSSDDNLTITTKIQTITNNNHSISLNPWQDMLSSSITTSPEKKVSTQIVIIIKINTIQVLYALIMNQPTLTTSHQHYGIEIRTL